MSSTPRRVASAAAKAEKGRTKGYASTRSAGADAASIAEEIESILAARGVHGFSRGHRIGRLVLNIEANAQNVDLMLSFASVRLRISKMRLKAYARAVTVWPSEDELARLRAETRAGRHLTWSHFVELADATSCERGELLERTILEKLTPRQIREVMGRQNLRAPLPFTVLAPANSAGWASRNPYLS